MDSSITTLITSAIQLDFSKDSMNDAVLTSNDRPVYIVSADKFGTSILLVVMKNVGANSVL